MGWGYAAVALENLLNVVGLRNCVLGFLLYCTLYSHIKRQFSCVKVLADIGMYTSDNIGGI